MQNRTYCWEIKTHSLGNVALGNIGISPVMAENVDVSKPPNKTAPVRDRRVCKVTQGKADATD